MQCVHNVDMIFHINFMTPLRTPYLVSFGIGMTISQLAVSQLLANISQLAVSGN
jgi:hypothetical protein